MTETRVHSTVTTYRDWSEPPYYTRREPQGDYVGYWGTKTDPDGKTRDRAKEKALFLEHAAEEIAFAKSLPVGHVLDYGAGLGWFLEELRACGWVGAAVELHRVEGFPTYDPTGTVPQVFDLAVCHHVIEHCDDPETVVRSLYLILKPGGRLILSTPDFASPCAKRFGDRYRMLHDGTHVSLFTLESMHRFLRDHGFRIDDVRFPFPERYATAETMARWARGPRDDEWSPPWPGNWMSFYCTKE